MLFGIGTQFFSHNHTVPLNGMLYSGSSSLVLDLENNRSGVLYKKNSAVVESVWSLHSAVSVKNTNRKKGTVHLFFSEEAMFHHEIIDFYVGKDAKITIHNITVLGNSTAPVNVTWFYATKFKNSTGDIYSRVELKVLEPGQSLTTITLTHPADYPPSCDVPYDSGIVFELLNETTTTSPAEAWVEYDIELVEKGEFASCGIMRGLDSEMAIVSLFIVSTIGIIRWKKRKPT